MSWPFLLHVFSGKSRSSLDLLFCFNSNSMKGISEWWEIDSFTSPCKVFPRWHHYCHMLLVTTHEMTGAATGMCMLTIQTQHLCVCLRVWKSTPHTNYKCRTQRKTSRHINLRAHFYICRPVCCLLQYVNSVWVENVNISAVSVMESYQNKLNKYSWKIRQMRTWRFQSWLFLHVFFSPTH